MARTNPGPPMRTITLEEHFVTPAFAEGAGRAFRDLLLSGRGDRAVILYEHCAISAISASLPWTPPASICRCSRSTPPASSSWKQPRRPNFQGGQRFCSGRGENAIPRALPVLPPFLSQRPRLPPVNWNAPFASMALREPSSTVITGVAIWTTNSSGRF